jgi:hypothetical protein
MGIRNLVLLGFIIFTAISSWILKIKMKRRMQRGLGRKVSDRELTSITTWMQVPPDEPRRGKTDADRP